MDNSTTKMNESDLAILANNRPTIDAIDGGIEISNDDVNLQ